MWQWFRSHLIFLVIFCAFLAYLPYFSVEFVWDDQQFIFDNKYILSGDVAKIVSSSITQGAGVVSNYFRPVTSLSFALDHAIWGLNPYLFRLTNSVIHVLAGLCIFALLRKLKMSTLAATVIAGIFVLHPIQVESVSYINSRGDSLFMLFGVLALLLFTSSFSVQKKQVFFAGIEYEFRQWHILAATVVSLVLAIFSKEIALAFIGLLGVIFLYKQTTSTHKSVMGAQLATLIICALLIGCYLYLRTTVWNFDDTFRTEFPSEAYTNSTYVRLHTFTKVFFLYQQKLLVPFPLHMEYQIEPVTQAVSIWLLGFVVITSLWLGIGWREYRIGKPWILLGFCWYFSLLIPVSGIIPVNGIMYEHWMYGPIVGWGMTLYGLYLLAYPRLHPYRHRILQFLTALFLLYGILTIRQNYYWSTPLRLYPYLLQYTESARIHNNLGMAYAESGQTEKAIQHYKRALELGTGNPQVHHNIANIYAAEGRVDEAIAEYRMALRILPDFYYSYTNLLNLLLLHRPSEVQPFIDEVTKHDPEWGAALLQLAKQLRPELFTEETSR